MNKLIPLEIKNQRILTTEQLAEIYETSIDNIKVNFNNHKSNFKEGKHYYLLKGQELREFKNQVNNIYPVDKHTSSLYLWTERGANRHCKILDTDKAWEQFDELEESYFTPQKNKPTCIEDVLISSLQEMKALRVEVQAVKQATTEAKEEIKGIREAVTLDPNQWRKDTAILINKIANKLGGFQHIEPIRKESYKLLNDTYGVDINRRLLNKRKNMALEGCSKTKINNTNHLDVIADDKKLVNGYINIVGRLAVKYGIKEI